MGYSEEPLVSIDYKGSTFGGVVDALSTQVLDGTMVKLLIWYDNESGFTNQLLRLLHGGQGLLIEITPPAGQVGHALRARRVAIPAALCYSPLPAPVAAHASLCHGPSRFLDLTCVADVTAHHFASMEKNFSFSLSRFKHFQQSWLYTRLYRHLTWIGHLPKPNRTIAPIIGQKW